MRQITFSIRPYSFLFIVCSFGASGVFAVTPLDEESLSKQTDHFARLSPIVISAVKEDAQLPLDEQVQAHDKIAVMRAGKAQVKNLESGVVSDYQIQKKSIALKPASNDKVVPVQVDNRPIIYEISTTNSNMRIEKPDHITIVVNPNNPSH
ncbi:hypothetical protein [Acinetobacter stercoris]|uniref:Uncharacterized protein n=1 Tax=Acinetobacter stercoris TaxID=2126983 RepID=A0A2U3N1B9_9GAMM|nr:MULTISPECIES: hypothetical protein [Acinetobacter]SPL71471.1 hypothetical protein KPC_2649 [Acinetobacter stercoris]